MSTEVSHFVSLYYEAEGVEIVAIHDNLDDAWTSRGSVEEWRGDRSRRWWTRDGVPGHSDWE